MATINHKCKQRQQLVSVASCTTVYYSTAMFYYIYKRPIVENYKAKLVSKATCFQLFSLLLVVVAPLLVTYRSLGFWKKTGEYFEQPSTDFEHQFVLLLECSSADHYLLWSSYAALNSLEQSHIRIATVQSSHDDFNRDGRADRHYISARVPLRASEHVLAVSVLLLFDYRLQLYSRLRMPGLVYARSRSSLPMSEAKFVGDLRLKQRIPLRHRGRDDRFNRPIINGTRPIADEFLLASVLQRYFERNVSTVYDYTDLTSAGSAASGEFLLSVTMDVPAQKVEYWCGFWELLKWAWVQYLSVLLIFLFVMSHIRDFVFSNQIVRTIPERTQSRQSG